MLHGEYGRTATSSTRAPRSQDLAGRGRIGLAAGTTLTAALWLASLALHLVLDAVIDRSAGISGLSVARAACSPGR